MSFASWDDGSWQSVLKNEDEDGEEDAVFPDLHEEEVINNAKTEAEEKYEKEIEDRRDSAEGRDTTGTGKYKEQLTRLLGDEPTPTKSGTLLAERAGENANSEKGKPSEEEPKKTREEKIQEFKQNQKKRRGGSLRFQDEEDRRAGDKGWFNKVIQRGKDVGSEAHQAITGQDPNKRRSEQHDFGRVAGDKSKRIIPETVPENYPIVGGKKVPMVGGKRLPRPSRVLKPIETGMELGAELDARRQRKNPDWGKKVQEKRDDKARRQAINQETRQGRKDNKEFDRFDQQLERESKTEEKQKQKEAKTEEKQKQKEAKRLERQQKKEAKRAAKEEQKRLAEEAKAKELAAQEEERLRQQTLAEGDVTLPGGGHMGLVPAKPTTTTTTPTSGSEERWPSIQPIYQQKVSEHIANLMSLNAEGKKLSDYPDKESFKSILDLYLKNTPTNEETKNLKQWQEALQRTEI